MSELKLSADQLDRYTKLIGEHGPAHLSAAGQRDLLRHIATLQREADGMREALLTTRAIVSEGATEGFRWDVGDWAQRLFANQARISAALNGPPQATATEGSE